MFGLTGCIVCILLKGASGPLGSILEFRLRRTDTSVPSSTAALIFLFCALLPAVLSALDALMASL